MHYEAEMESFLLHLVPNDDKEWEGASNAEIEEIENLSGQKLPSFYRWLISRVGKNIGSLPQEYNAFNAQKVIELYQNGEINTKPPFLFIERFEDPIMPMDLYYDLSRQTHNDAFVVGGVGTELSNKSETLREWLAWSTLIALRIVSTISSISPVID